LTILIIYKAYQMIVAERRRKFLQEMLSPAVAKQNSVGWPRHNMYHPGSGSLDTLYY
jgi:hypothetical protein